MEDVLSWCSMRDVTLAEFSDGMKDGDLAVAVWCFSQSEKTKRSCFFRELRFQLCPPKA